MRQLIYLLLVILCTQFSYAQTKLDGLWKGFIVNQKNQNPTVIYLDFKITQGTIQGESREEIPNSTAYLMKKIKGQIKNNQMDITQFGNIGGKAEKGLKYCFHQSVLNYQDSTGYFIGNWTSTNCKEPTLKIVLFKSEGTISKEKINHSTWLNKALLNYQKGYYAPMKIEEERKNFQFKTIYFNSDESIILDEFKPYLMKMAKIIDGHSDLRIKITGHTDGDGNDEYNLNLSKERAKSIEQFFESKGLSKDKMVIEFKGETSPIDTNDTPQGKQQNRRVEFSFI